MSEPWRAREVVDLAPLVDGATRFALGVDLDGGVHVAAGRWLRHWSNGHVEVVRLREATRASFVQPLPEGTLLVDGRSGPGRSNASVVDGAGNVVRRFAMHDAIADVRTTRDGAIWASYFDEGDWIGLATFGPDGVERWRYDPSAAGTDAVVDAYAMNVAREGDAWLYFYTEFPIVRIRDGRYHRWRTDIRGACALAVRGDRALLFGSYDAPDVAHVLTFGADGVASPVEARQVVGPEDEPLGRTPAWGVGDRLYLLSERRLLVLDGW